LEGEKMRKEKKKDKRRSMCLYWSVPWHLMSRIFWKGEKKGEVDCLQDTYDDVVLVFTCVYE
jgi:hypothetical protein